MDRFAAETGRLIRLCLHGAESTGKSTLARQLHADLGIPWVPEFGRHYAEAHGVNFTMDDLLAIARGQDAAMRQAAASSPSILILDTDPLMTAAWARMMYGEAPRELLAYDKAELYLLFAPDTPWVEDGTRMFGSAIQRTRFAGLCELVLQEAEVDYLTISGDWAERRLAVEKVIARLS